MNDKTAFPSDTADKVLVRMPDGMRDNLKAAAKANNRTMNAEIVARLQETFDGPKLGFGPGSVGERLEQARQQLDASMQIKLEQIKQELLQAVIDRYKGSDPHETLEQLAKLGREIDSPKKPPKKP